MNPTVDCLNEAFKRDPNAIACLLLNRVPCNTALADDPLVQVHTLPTIITNDQTFQIGTLGLINGVLMANKLPLVAYQFSIDADENGRHKIVGFQEYTGGSV